MKLDRNERSDGGGKYAVINMRKVREIYEAEGGPGPEGNAVAAALAELKSSGVLNYGEARTEGEFFVLMLKDMFAGQALNAYARIAEGEYALEIFNLAKRAGTESPWCKIPD